MKFLWIILFILVIQTASAIRINEVELNPAENDAGNEWMELYDKGEFILDGYKIANNDGEEIELSGTFKGYYIYVFQKQWLDNSDEKIFLYKNGELIDETDLLKDDKNNDDTWSYCDDWKFGKSTKEKKNDCEEEEESRAKESENDTTLSTEEEETEITNTEPQIIETINLNPKTIKIGDNSKDSSRNYARYWLVGFCILLGFLFLLKIRKDRLNKNEFEK